MQQIDNYARWAIYEAMDECGVYHNPTLENQLVAYALKLTTQKQFSNLPNNYNKFCLRLIAFIEELEKLK